MENTRPYPTIAIVALQKIYTLVAKSWHAFCFNKTSWCSWMCVARCTSIYLFQLVAFPSPSLYCFTYFLEPTCAALKSHTNRYKIKESRYFCRGIKMIDTNGSEFLGRSAVCNWFNFSASRSLLRSKSFGETKPTVIYVSRRAFILGIRFKTKVVASINSAAVIWQDYEYLKVFNVTDGSCWYRLVRRHSKIIDLVFWSSRGSSQYDFLIRFFEHLILRRKTHLMFILSIAITESKIDRPRSKGLLESVGQFYLNTSRGILTLSSYTLYTQIYTRHCSKSVLRSLYCILTWLKIVFFWYRG